MIDSSGPGMGTTPVVATAGDSRKNKQKIPIQMESDPRTALIWSRLGNTHILQKLVVPKLLCNPLPVAYREISDYVW